MVAKRRLHYLTFLASLVLYSLQYLDAQEQKYSSIANLSTTWINHPSVYDSLLKRFSPILTQGGDGTRFACDLYCKNESFECVFGVLIYRSLTPHSSLQKRRLVWSANRNNPVQTNATLELRQDGDLVLANSDGTFVWSSNTGRKSVSGLNLTETGNLMLFGRNSETIWQSIDHPTDSLHGVFITSKTL